MMIARGWLYPDVSDMLKELYVEACADRFKLEGKRLTDSRVSLLTGLQRKDVKALRARLQEPSPDRQPMEAGPLPRVLARWMSGLPYSDGVGAPRPLPRTGETPSFETLIAEISRDIHARTILDELKRQGLAEHDQAADTVRLTAPAYLPNRDDDALVGYFGANLGDHAEAAAENLDAAPEPGPFFERATHYNKLTPDAVRQLDTRARELQTKLLADLSAEALALQKRDTGDPAATGRFRCGAYIYRSSPDRAETDE